MKIRFKSPIQIPFYKLGTRVSVRSTLIILYLKTVLFYTFYLYKMTEIVFIHKFSLFEVYMIPERSFFSGDG